MCSPIMFSKLKECTPFWQWEMKIQQGLSSVSLPGPKKLPGRQPPGCSWECHLLLLAQAYPHEGTGSEASNLSANNTPFIHWKFGSSQGRGTFVKSSPFQRAVGGIGVFLQRFSVCTSSQMGQSCPTLTAWGCKHTHTNSSHTFRYRSNNTDHWIGSKSPTHKTLVSLSNFQSGNTESTKKKIYIILQMRESHY